MSDKELCRICERADAEAWWSMLEGADPQYKERYNIRSERSGGMVIGATGAFDVVALNRAVGVEIDHATSQEEVQRIVRLFEETGSRRYAVQLCPSASTDAVLSMLKDEGFTHFNNWTKLIRKTDDPVQSEDSPLRVEKIDASTAPVFADIVCRAFGWPGLLKQWVGGLVGLPGWSHYLAYRDTEPVATGAMFISNGVAWLGFAGTKTDHRRMGAQRALIQQRLVDARAARCSHVVVETAEDKPDRPNPSYHNLIRSGFTPAYQRPNYIRVKDLQH